MLPGTSSARRGDLPAGDDVSSEVSMGIIGLLVVIILVIVLLRLL